MKENNVGNKEESKVEVEDSPKTGSTDVFALIKVFLLASFGFLSSYILRKRYI